ncbi:hypothetical protein acsn021_05300 [Anaerocolumna cellulosilytica]|uniref:Uncharacterized protein n=1 Tax=Anaerocolumna cellulosilytica TaxID=433286 RepID=A0A6S6R154_9FIRM|nr:hypothetical protein [Anaerocolumna cellulosilytica]MBB5195703.1 hypothetical protein [Anaerocolumna cellulosilytica]BCJ92961.1 hypothetical protein acsn021_05300 [Anaerocolumna cellulosilytica]
MKKVHFSIDDIIMSLRWLEHNRPSSIFDMELYGKLLEWNRKYGLKVSCYAFGNNGSDFQIESIPKLYINEIINNKDWLRFAYHGVYGNQYQNDSVLFRRELENFHNIFGQENLAHIVRLHCWQCSSQEIEYLKGSGVTTLLCPDRGTELFYDLSISECNAVRRNLKVKKGNLSYLKTNVRYDDMQDISCLKEFESSDTVVLFGHEGLFRDKVVFVEETLKYFYEEGYTFVI